MLHKDFLKLYWKQYLSLEKDLLQMDDYVTIDSKNYGCFSNNFAKIFMMACSELDSLVLKFDEIIKRDLFIEKALPKSFPQKLDMLLYKYKNLHNMRISTKADICEINFVPFTNFTENETDGWWKDYNLVKHNRTEINPSGKYNYEKANLKNTMTALSALYLVCCLFDSYISESDAELIPESRLFTIMK